MTLTELEALDRLLKCAEKMIEYLDDNCGERIDWEIEAGLEESTNDWPLEDVLAKAKETNTEDHIWLQTLQAECQIPVLKTYLHSYLAGNIMKKYSDYFTEHKDE